MIIFICPNCGEIYNPTKESQYLGHGIACNAFECFLCGIEYKIYINCRKCFKDFVIIDFVDYHKI